MTTQNIKIVLMSPKYGQSLRGVECSFFDPPETSVIDFSKVSLCPPVSCRLLIVYFYITYIPRSFCMCNLRTLSVLSLAHILTAGTVVPLQQAVQYDIRFTRDGLPYIPNGRLYRLVRQESRSDSWDIELALIDPSFVLRSGDADRSFFARGQGSTGEETLIRGPDSVPLTDCRQLMRSRTNYSRVVLGIDARSEISELYFDSLAIIKSPTNHGTVYFGGNTSMHFENSCVEGSILTTNDETPNFVAFYRGPVSTTGHAFILINDTYNQSFGESGAAAEVLIGTTFFRPKLIDPTIHIVELIHEILVRSGAIIVESMNHVFQNCSNIEILAPLLPIFSIQLSPSAGELLIYPHDYLVTDDDGSVCRLNFSGMDDLAENNNRWRIDPLMIPNVNVLIQRGSISLCDSAAP